MAPFVSTARVRQTVSRVPVLGTAARYVRRLVALPWTFHKHRAATAAFQADLLLTLHGLAAAQTRTAVDLANQQTGALADHTGVVLYDILPPMMASHLTALRADTKEILADVATELHGLNDRHAGCYDRLNETIRDQAADLRRLTDTLADLTARVDDLAARAEPHAPTLLRRAG